MNRSVFFAFVASVAFHGVLLYVLARTSNHAVSQGGFREWTEPLSLSAFRRGAIPAEKPSRAEPAGPVEPVEPAGSVEADLETPSEKVSKAVPEERSFHREAAREAPAASPDVPAVSSDSVAPEARSSVSGRAGDRPPRLLVGALTSDREGSREVDVRILVGIDGRVVEVQPVDPAVDPELLRIIRKAAESMRFVPAMKNGRDVAAWLEMGFVL